MSNLAVGQVIRLADGRNAVVRFVGETLFAPGEWVGVELDDGTGKNDGSVQGERYFDCDMGNGMFVRATAVTIVSHPPPKPKAAAPTTAAKKRPSSFAAGSRSASQTLDPAAGRRRSINAPSPSPVPRTSRPSSIARVRDQGKGVRYTCANFGSFSDSLLPNLPRNSSELRPRVLPLRELVHLQTQELGQLLQRHELLQQVPHGHRWGHLQDQVASRPYLLQWHRERQEQDR